MRCTAGVRIDAEDSPVDSCTVYSDLFGDMFIDQSGQTVALPLSFQKQLVDLMLENIDRHEHKQQPKKGVKPVLAVGMMMSMAMLIASPGLGYHNKICWNKEKIRCLRGAPKLITPEIPMPRAQT